VTICGVDVDFSINHTWGQPQSLPIATASAVALLRAAIERRARFEPIVNTRRGPGVGYAATDAAKEAIDPAFGVRFMQREMPLGEPLAKIGETQIAGPKRVDLAVFDGSEEVAVRPALHDFVRGHFFEVSEAERLRAPDFEELDAGFEFASDTLDFDATKAVAETYDYEIILLGIEDDRTTPATRGPALTLPDRFADRWAGVNHMRVAVAADSPIGVLRPVEPVAVGKTRFVAATAVAAIAAAPTSAERATTIAAASTSFTRVMSAAARLRMREANAGVADYVVGAAALGRS
jgi:hypothetical protein